MKRIVLMPRLRLIADLVGETGLLWDVGTDHGKLPASLLVSGRIRHAIASDIREGPLERAKKTAEACGVEDRMTFLLCDGLDMSVDRSIDVVVIAGMGGEAIAGIIERAARLADGGTRLLLQPMSSIEDLRQYLYSGGYTVLGEYLVRERGRLYVVIEAKAGGVPEPYDLADTRVGKHLRFDPLFPDYAGREIRRLRNELAGAGPDRTEEILRAVERIRAMKEEAEVDNRG